MNKKFKLTSEEKEVWGIKLYRIEAISSFGSVSKGDKGGFVEKEENVSQEGDAWVYGNAQVFGDARVYGNAQVYGDAWVYGNARVYGDARVYGNARVYGDAWVYKKEKIVGGYFYHTKLKTEKIEVVVNDENYETLCFNPKYDAESPAKNLKGKVVKVEIEGEKYEATIN